MYRLSVIYFGDHKSVGRAKMLTEALPSMTNIVSTGVSPNIFEFGFRALKALCRSRNILIMNRRAAFIFFLCYPALCCFRHLSRPKVIYDMWEFYTYKEHTSLTSRAGTFFEIFTLKRVNRVIVCNSYRKSLVRRIHGLKNIDVVENLRVLPAELNKAKNLKEQYLSQLNLAKANFVITNGFSIERGDEKLLEAFQKEPSCSLTFIGSSTSGDRSILKKYIASKCLKNINAIDSVPHSELAEVVKFFDYGVVNYSTVNLNNKYCASGKIFEFMALGLPVLTSDNPTLKSLVKTYNCGESTNDFRSSIMKLVKYSKQYQANVQQINFDHLLVSHRNHIREVIVPWIGA